MLIVAIWPDGDAWGGCCIGRACGVPYCPALGCAAWPCCCCCCCCRYACSRSATCSGAAQWQAFNHCHTTQATSLIYSHFAGPARVEAPTATACGIASVAHPYACPRHARWPMRHEDDIVCSLDTHAMRHAPRSANQTAPGPMTVICPREPGAPACRRWGSPGRCCAPGSCPAASGGPGAGAAHPTWAP